jgi:hypothetical protein
MLLRTSAALVSRDVVKGIQYLLSGVEDCFESTAGHRRVPAVLHRVTNQTNHTSP